MDKTQALRQFLVVARLGSFSAAARELQCAVSSISRQLDGLESELGVSLFARSTHQLQLTEAGELLRSRVGGALQELDDAVRDVAESDGRLRGPLRLTAPVAFGQRYLRPLMPRLMAEFPLLQFDLELSDEYRDLINDHIDLAIRVGGSQDERLIVQTLTSNAHLVCASPAYLDGHPAPATFADLDGAQCLLHRIPGIEPHWQFGDRHQPQRLLPRGTLSSNDSDLILNAALSGCGIALLPWWMVAEPVNQGALVQLLPDLTVIAPISDALYFAFPAPRRYSRKVRAVRDFLLANLAQVGHMQG